MIYMMFLDIVLHQFLKIRKTNKTNKQKKNQHGKPNDKTGGRLYLKKFPAWHCVSRRVCFWIATYEKFFTICKWLKYHLKVG